MNITYQSALEYGLEPTAVLTTQGFSGYFVPIQFTVPALLNAVRQDSVDLNLSRIIFDEGQAVGVALIARRGWTSRLAAMSIIPEARGRGIGEVCVLQLLDEAKARGDKGMVLEVIEQNAPAVRLYQKCGFQIQRRLIGFSGQPESQVTDVELYDIDIREVAMLVRAFSSDDLPWQLSGETLAQAGPPNIAHRNEAACVVLSNPDASTIVIRAIVTLLDFQRQGNATYLLQGIFARYPGKTWRVIPIFPEELGGLFEKVGLQRDSLSQWQMKIDLER